MKYLTISFKVKVKVRRATLKDMLKLASIDVAFVKILANRQIDNYIRKSSLSFLCLFLYGNGNQGLFILKETIDEFKGHVNKMLILLLA